MIRLVIWDLGDTLNTPPPGGQDTRPLDEYPEIRLRTHAIEVLRALQEKGYRQAVLSNTAVSDSDSARRMLIKLGIDLYFDHVYATASELDPRKPGKPDPIVFQSVLEALQVSSHETVMVGNTWDTDILGANHSGIHAIWLQNPDVCVRKDVSSPVVTPPWIIPVWDILNVPEAVNILSCNCERHSVTRSTSPAMKGFSHVTIDVSDLEKSLRFYVETLGMKLVHRGRKDAYLEWGAAWICLQEKPELPPQRQQIGVDHVALYIEPDEFGAAVEVLRTANVPIVRGPVERGGGWTVNFLDPDGTQLEFHTGTLAKRMKVWR
jgi:catechol 2,3-dioxygenase-like lactoylglutathione lyase family enzyme/histidinol phosphatase-like enzyme